MQVDILGSLAVRDRDGHDVRLPAGRERSLLVLLLLHRGAAVSSDRIVDALWGERAPDTAGKAVQGYVSHLRRVLPDGAGSALLTRPPGYVLGRDAVDLDADRFERLAGDARRALDDDAPAEAAALLETALALWRGPALADVAFEDFAQDEIRRLEALRLAATEDRLDALLRLGRHREVTTELGALVAAHPERERLRGQLMLALYRGGRQADALQVYRDGRRLLASELGLTPGPELQRLERAILEQDPSLEASAPEPAPAAEVEAAPTSAPAPPPAAPGRRPSRQWVLVLAVALLLAVAAAVAAIVLRDDAPTPALSLEPPAVVAVDPDTNRTVASIGVGSLPVSLAAVDGAVWVGDARDGTVTRIETERLAVAGTIGIGVPAVDLDGEGGDLWVAGGGFGELVHIDTDLDAVVGRVSLGSAGDPIVPSVSAVALEGGRVWAGVMDGMVEVDPLTSRVEQRVDLDHAAALAIVSDDGALWASTIRRAAWRVDAGSGRVTADYHAGAFAPAMALDRAGLWLGGLDTGDLVRLDPLTGSQTLTGHAGSGVTGLALGLGSLWVVAFPERALLRVDPETARVEATIPLAGAPQEVVVANGLVWVALQEAPSSS